MSLMNPTPAKIIQHSKGMGTPCAENVRQRAQELAVINGRLQYNEEDWREAKRELHGGHETSESNDDFHEVALVSEHDMVAGSLGRHVENMGVEDRENIVEELIAEGMDEAVHEQMLAASREGLREEASEE